jgi:hypothetical protein
MKHCEGTPAGLNANAARAETARILPEATAVPAISQVFAIHRAAPPLPLEQVVEQLESRELVMKLTRTHWILGVAIVGVALVGTAARTRAVQEWYDTVTVQGTVTSYLLDDRAEVEGLLLDNGQQVRVGRRLGAVVASRIKKGDAVSAVGHGGRKSAFGRLVNAESVTVNGQTLTLVGEPEGRGGPRGRGGRGREDGPGPRGSRGAPPPPPPGRGGADAPSPAGHGPSDAPPPPPRPGADPQPAPGAPAAPPVQPPPPAQGAEPAVAPPPPPPDGDPAAGPEGPGPAAAAVTVKGAVAAYLVGGAGEVVGLALTTGEQVRFPPRVGERLMQSAGSHPEVSVTGEVVRSDYGIIVRPAQLTVGSQTLLLR